MPHKAFLKKKSLLDRFKDDHALTGFIPSARAKHTWDNPLTRRKRTKELNGWIKSFAGKDHIRKLSRFNAQQAGRYEALQVAHPDVEFDCLRYADTLELPNGVCVNVYPTIRCPRRCAFVFRVMGFGEVDPALNKNAGKLKYAIHGYYPVYGLERQPSEEFDIYCDDVSELQKWSNCNGWGMGVGPSASSMEAAREVAKGKETMKNEKVILSITERFDPSQYDYFKASYTLDGTNRVKNTNGIVDAQGTLEMAQRHGATNLNLVGVKDGTETDIPLSDVGISESKDEAMSLKGFLEALEEKLVKQFDLDEEEVKSYLDAHTQEMQELLDDKELSLKEKVLFVRSEITGEKDEAKEPTGDDTLYIVQGVDDFTDFTYAFTQDELKHIKDHWSETDWRVKMVKLLFGDDYENELSENPDILDEVADSTEIGTKQELLELNYPEHLFEAKEPTEEKLGYEKGHKNSKGENAPWVIRSHKDNRILASFTKKTDAEEHLQRMKQYSKQESKSADELDKYIKDVKSLLKSKYGMDFNDKDTCRLNVGWLEKLDAMFYQGKPVEDGAKEVAAFCGYNKDESKKSEANGPFDAPIKDWYMGAYKEDDLGDRLNGTFKGALQTLLRGDDIYDYIGVGDSLIRERLFSKLAEMLDVDYDEIYNVWLNEGAASNELTAKLNKIGLKRTRTIPPTIKDKVNRLGRGVLPPKIVKVTGESKKSERLFNKAEMEKIALSEASSLDNYRNDVISELAVSFHYGEDGATKLADKYSDTINDAYVEGESLPYETARLIARQDGNGYANESKKSESKKSEVRLELIDTIVVPKWLWEAYNFGNEYGEDLDDHEQNILSEFKEKYADCHLDDEDEESYFSSYNDFDSYGGQCFTVKVYKEK